MDHIKDVCDRFAADGFVALAPDLFHGKTTKSPDEAGKLMMALRIDEAEKDPGAGVDYLSNHDTTITTQPPPATPGSARSIFFGSIYSSPRSGLPHKAWGVSPRSR